MINYRTLTHVKLSLASKVKKLESYNSTGEYSNAVELYKRFDNISYIFISILGGYINIKTRCNKEFKFSFKHPDIEFVLECINAYDFNNAWFTVSIASVGIYLPTSKQHPNTELVYHAKSYLYDYTFDVYMALKSMNNSFNFDMIKELQTVRQKAGFTVND